MSKLCGIPACNRAVSSVCDCCHIYICRYHMNEHNEFLNMQLNPLVDEINILDGQLKSFDIHKTTAESREKLQQWRIECHEKIDRLFEKKCQELDQCILMKVSRQSEQINDIQTKLNHLMYGQKTTRQDIDFLTSNIYRLKKQMNTMEQTYIQIHPRPLVMTDSMLRVTETLRPKIYLLNLPPANNIINHSSDSYSVLTSNSKFLLIHQAPHLCLIDQEMHVVNRVSWSFQNIIDMCWSSTLERFIIINENSLFLMDENLLIQKISTIKNVKCLSCTCSDISLYLSTSEQGSSIMEFALLPNIELITNWQPPVTCEKNERIDTMFYNNGRIALVVRNYHTKFVRIELRFPTTFDYIWSLTLDIQWDKKIPFHCCSLSFEEWLVADYKNSRILHITKCGQLKTVITYKTAPSHLHLFNQNILVVLTKHGKNLHQLL